MKLGVTVEMEIVETAIFTEYVLGQTLAKAKVLGELRDGRPKKTMLNEHRFSLKDAGITNHESEHAQRFVEYVERFDLESFQLLVREHKLNRTLSRSGIAQDYRSGASAFDSSLFSVLAWSLL